MAEKRKLTKSGYKALEEELRDLIDVKLPECKKQLSEARAEGDLSENADYDAARALQAEIEGRIKQIQEILNNAELIAETKSGSKKVSLGSTVVLKDLGTGEKDEYTIVDTVESDPFKGWISHSCVLGSAILGKSVGDKVEIKAQEPYMVEILEIKVLDK